jgi:uncharacterized protein
MAFVYRTLLRTALALSAILLSVNSSFSQSLLYSVSGNGLNNTVYIFGTIHAIPQSDFFIDDTVLEKLVASEKVYFEIDMDSPTMMAELQANMMMKGNSIDKLITEEEYNKLRKLMLDSLGLPLDYLKQVKPMLMSAFFLPKIVGPNPASYEGFLLAKAKEHSIEILGIETVAEQMGYIDSIPESEQVKILLESAYDLATARIEFRKLIEIYKSKNIEEINRYIVESSEEYQQFGDYLLVARNKSWIPRFVNIANEHKAFIAVGAGHLGGENGVVSLLRKEGYIVEEVK